MPSLRGSRTKSFENGGAIRDENGVLVPSRTSSLHSRIAQPLPTALSMRTGQRAPKTLTHAYMVCGVGREPSQWVRAPVPTQGKIAHMKGAVGQFWLPEILGSSPRLEQDNDIARSLHAAMRACFPHDVEICTGKSQPHCVHHSFVLQQDSSHTLYGIALRVWSRADEKRAETIRDLRKRTEPDYYDAPDETYWIPYCLSFLSRYPLYNLLGDYLRGMWIHWNKATNLFHAEEVSRILSFPAPRLNDLVRIDMKDYALCYQFPSSPTGFQNFSMWPLFMCLSVPNIIGVLEAAVSPTRRIIFVTHYPAMLTVAAETVRYLIRVYEWSGLYVPVVHARHATDLVQEPGPYILGVTAECRSLFTAPPDALVVDLDRNFVLTSSPPDALAPKQRSKLISQLNSTLSGEVIPTGVPQHLRSAYGGGKLIPAGQIIIMKGEVESVQDPEWWNQDAVMSVMDGVCEKLGRNTGIKKIFGGSAKKPLMTKVSTRHLNEVVRERNQYSRDATEAWQDYINLKGRMDTELGKVTKRNNFLVEELESWRQQLLKFQSTVEDLTRKSQTLQSTIENHKRENRRLASLIEQQRTDTERLNDRLVGTSKQRDDALQALAVEKETRAELERERQRNKKELVALQQNQAGVIRQRDDAQRVVLHLHSLIDGQSHHMQHIVKDLRQAPRQSTNNLEAEPQHEESLIERVEESAAGLVHGFRETFGLATHPYNEHTAAKQNAAPSRDPTYSRPPMDDEADRYLHEKTESIAYILRNISEQCAAAVDSLQLAQRSSSPEVTREGNVNGNGNSGSGSGKHYLSRDFAQSEMGAEPSLLEGGDEETVRTDMLSTPSTPDLEHGSGNRNSSSMSVTTEGTFRDSGGPLSQHETTLPSKMVALGRYDASLPPPPQFGAPVVKGQASIVRHVLRGEELV